MTNLTQPFFACKIYHLYISGLLFLELAPDTSFFLNSNACLKYDLYDVRQWYLLLHFFQIVCIIRQLQDIKQLTYSMYSEFYHCKMTNLTRLFYICKTYSLHLCTLLFLQSTSNIRFFFFGGGSSFAERYAARQVGWLVD